jgi:hypothetical protein
MTRESALRSRRSAGIWWAVRCGAAALVIATAPGRAQRFETLNGPPVQMRPYVSEPGAPQVTVTTGTPAFAGLDSVSSGSDGGTVIGSSALGGSTTEISGGSDSLSTMLGTSWGAQASSNA